MNVDSSTLDKIKCPHCGRDIPVSETILNQLTEKAQKQAREEMFTAQEALKKKEAELRKAEETVNSAKENELPRPKGRGFLTAAAYFLRSP